MSIQTIKCPHCGGEVPLTEAISSQLRTEIQGEYAERMKAVQADVAKREKAVAQREEKTEEAIAQRIAAERTKLEAELKRKAQEAVLVDLEDLRQQTAEMKGKLDEAVKNELALRKERRELEELQKNAELERQRALDAERAKIAEETRRRFEEEHRPKDQQKDKMIDDMKGQIDELKRKLEQGSQQLQGEAEELSLEDLLKKTFVHDVVEEVPKGVRGADAIHKVMLPTGEHIGTIIWESKQTKAWSDGWIAKLKSDQRDAKAELAAIVSVAMPDDIRSVGYRDGVWICDPLAAVGLAMALRSQLVEVAAAKGALIGQQGKMEAVYTYLSGTSFRQKIEGIVEAFTSMRVDLEGEKRAMNKHWAKRDEQIHQVLLNTTRMYGELHAIIGASLPEIASLEIKALEAPEVSAEATDDSAATDPQVNDSRPKRKRRRQ